MLIRRLSGALIALALPASLKSQISATAPVHEQAATLRAARRAGAIRIDGKLDDAAWQAAPAFLDFRQIDPAEGQPASERTEARILIDDDAVYVGIWSFDSEPGKIQKQLTRRDEPIEADIVEVTLDSYHDHLSAFHFRLSPLGARRDATITANGQDGSWDSVWEGNASVDAKGWYAEFRIPLSQLRYDPGNPDHVWGLQIGRRIARKGEYVVFSHTPKSVQQGVNRYGHLTGLGKLAAPRRIELVPYVSARNTNPSVATNDPFRKKNEIAPGAGLDLKYGITSNFTIDATLNPDFGQVEVDPAVVNLSAFETFFPERRPFFIEGASIFRFGAMRSQNQSNGYTFLHTRRIGRSPQRFLGGNGISFVDAPLETTIAGATKLTGRTKNGWSVGLLDAVTLKETARFRVAAVRDSAAPVEPLANYAVGRIKRDLRGGNTTIGIGATAVNRHLDDPSLVPIFRSAAYIGGIDWNHAWGNRRWAFDGNVVLSHNRGSAASIDALQTSSVHYFQRPDRTSYRRDPSKTSLTGHLAELTLAKLSGRHWKGSVTYQDYNPGFEINEAGFQGSTDTRAIAPLISYSENTPNKVFRTREHYLFWNPTWNYDGDMTYNGVGAVTFILAPNYWSYLLRLDYRPAVYDDRLTRGGPVAAAPSGGQVNLEINSDRRKMYTGGLVSSYGRNAAGGWASSVSPRTTLRPNAALRITLQPNFSRTHALAQFVTRSVDALASDTYGTRYVFATLDQNQLSLTTRVDWTFTPSLSLQVFAQPLLVAGDFQDYKELSEPRVFAFDVYGRDAGTITRGATGLYTVDPDAGGAAAPFSFQDRDFNSRFLRGNAVLRWEYRPGSALFLVWQQSRQGSIPSGEFDFRRDFDALFESRPENVFVVKGTWWVGR